MADRTTNTLYETKRSDRLAIPIANGESLPVGSLVQIQSGFANHYDGTTMFAGIVVGGENLSSTEVPTGDTSLTPDPCVYVDTTGPTIVGIPVASATVIGAYVYCNDSNLDNATITQPSTDAPIGFIVGFRSASDCDVQLFTPAQHTIGVNATGAAWA
tara:strand:+ start:2402 stop:2875 length:474 start_codon:yes stop_codon:yes gene_type:complete